jgi:wyosine [tRNA(Phe)-imidazoG37] synthetase (radical SAM superfamily)
MAKLDLSALLAKPREFMGNQFVYAVITSRAGGLSVGVNMNPDQRCNFDCCYCEVRRIPEKLGAQLELQTLKQELLHVVAMAYRGHLRTLDQFAMLPAELLELKEVALSGDGEPSLVSNFDEVVREILLIRHLTGPFKMVLFTNGTGLHLPAVQRGLQYFEPTDEIWIKLDTGTEGLMRRINGTALPLDAVTNNIIALGRSRPVVIQSLFCILDGQAPSDDEVATFVEKLRELKAHGAQIALVQVYSVSRSPARPGCKHLPLARLSQIAREVRTKTGLKAEVF